MKFQPQLLVAAAAALSTVAEARLNRRLVDDALDDLAKCTRVASKFITVPVPRQDAIDMASSYCDSDPQIQDRIFICPHFKEGVERALELQAYDKQYDAAEFCEATEQYMLDIRGASRVSNTGTGPLLDFKISDQCTDAVASAFHPMEELESSMVPDFWYAMCMNQDCAHFLQSRSKWCNTQKTPTHSYVVCEAVRKFAMDAVQAHEEKTMTPHQICALYGEFVKEMGIDVDAYEHAIHSDTTERVRRHTIKEHAKKNN